MPCQSVLRLQRRILALSSAMSLGSVLVLGTALQAHAADFSISPISVELTPGIRSTSVGIRNTDQRPLRFQLSLVEWTQDAQGNDVYTPSDDLVYFPRQLTVRPGDRNIARIGPKRDTTGMEKTYRLRVEELPDTTVAQPFMGTGSSLNMMISFAIPVFQGTPDAAPLAVITPMQLQGGQLSVTVQNAGRSHFRIETLELSGANDYSQRQSGWYLLAGASRQYSMAITPEVCRTQRHLSLKVKVGDRAFTSDLTVDPSMCGT